MAAAKPLHLAIATLVTLLGCSQGELSEPTQSAGTGGIAIPHGGSSNGGSSNGGSSNGGKANAGNTSGGSGNQGGTSSGGSASGGGLSTSGGANASGGTSSDAPPKLCTLELTCPSEIVEDTKIACQLSIGDGLGGSVYADHVGIELRGRSSIEYPKPNYGIELRTQAGEENPVNVLGMGKEADWVLDGSWVDRSFMRNMLTFSLFRDMGWYAARGRFCTLSLNGEARGIYEIREKIKRDDDRVALTLDDGSGSSFLLKQDSDGSLRLSIGAGSRWQLIYPNEETATAAQVMAAQAFLNQLDTALNSANPGDPTTGLPALIDITQAVDFVLIEEFSKNVDAYNLSLFLARDAGKPARFVPWDLDLAYGQPTIRNSGANPASTGWVNTRTRLITALIKVDALLSALGPRWRTLRAGPLSNAAINQKLDRYQTTLEASAIAANFAKWPIADVDFSEIYAPYTLYPVSSYAEEITHFRSWIEARLSWMDSNIDNYPN
ncbi:MAG: CotH kinase family protein [Myxococcota bacterium]